MNVKEHFKQIQKGVGRYYSIAREARRKGIDPVADVEIPVAMSLAEKAVGLISTLYPQINDKRIVNRILELEKEFGSLNPAIALIIAEEIAKEKFCKFKDFNEAIQAGIRVAMSYMTLGVVSSPIEGFVELKFGKTVSGEDYFKPYYAGPIRSAGGTEAGFSLVIIDYLREIFGYAKYDPIEEEAKRGVHESYMYHERVTNLQYLPREEEIEFLMKNVPVQIAGDPSADFEVYNYKDLKRVESNIIRSGFCLVLNEGLAQKAPKILGRIKKLREKGFKLSDWDFLEEFVALQNKLKKSQGSGGGGGAVYIKDLVAGRPVLGHPSRSGSFRLRYGRARNTGYSALGLHPATMRICGDFIAVGTQLKLEKPTKGCTIAAVSSIDGPIVKFRDGSVKKLNEEREARERYKDVKEILYFGDLLIPYGDFMNRNHVLEKAGYVEQYWTAELREKGGEVKEKGGVNTGTDIGASLDEDTVENTGANAMSVGFDEAVKLSKKFGIALHPKFIFYWNQINYEEFLGFVDWLGHCELKEGKLVFPYDSTSRERFVKGKRALELLGVEHKISVEFVVIEKENSKALLFNLGIEEFDDGELNGRIDRVSERLKELKEENSGEDVLGSVDKLCSVEIRDKAGTFIGARMGRPEKAKLRKLTGSPHVLFPVGEEGGRLRSFQAAMNLGYVKGEFPNFYCNNCKQERVYGKCGECGEFCVKGEEKFSEKRIDIREYFDKAKKITGVRIEDIPVVKGVRGTSNAEHDCENLAKGILRAKYGLHVNKDGTIRYDMTEMPITHFKPREIGTSFSKLRELGYEKDVNGGVLVSDEQTVEIFPHDVILPACPDTLDERADDVLLKICNFVDDELERIYGLKRFFNCKSREDFVGVLVANIAPHICTAVVGRVIGFSKTQVFLASPYMHAAMRRDCDGDESAFMLLMDLLLNFSRKFLPAHRGGTQDAPLVLSSCIKAGEVDDMIFDLDVSQEISLEVYRAGEAKKNPDSVKIEQVKGRLGGEKEFHDLFYSYDTDDVNSGPMCSAYKSLPTMNEKVDKMMELCKKIRAVDITDLARLVIERHFIRDTRGNLRKFSMQLFRCVNCNLKFRRPPLGGQCTKCGGKLMFTISEGSILKYMQKALELAREYKVSAYLLESLELTEMYIQSIFGKEKEKQESIGKWF